MLRRTTITLGTRVAGLCLGPLLGCLGYGCETKQAQPGWSGPLDADASSYPTMNLGPGYAADAGSTKLACTAAQPGAQSHPCGNYDILSCNAPNCHGTMIGGGWVYTNPNGPPFLGGATITIYNIDGSIVTSVSGDDGFFEIVDPVKPPYKVCASECPGTNCSLEAHPSADCQTSNCHGKPGQKIYVSLDSGNKPDAGNTPATDAGSGNCTPPASGGPYTHTEPAFGNQACSSGGCHCPPGTVFQGGFLYDGPLSSTTIAEATLTITPASGKPIKVVSGVDGMFFIGTVTDSATPIPLTAPFTACVSKCPTTVCSTPNGHTTTNDCQSSNCHDSYQHVYLR